MILSIHAISHDTKVNGPGRRAMVHFQGCTLGCPACFNPDTHALNGRRMTVAQVAETLLDRAPKGVTVSGGEPFQQAGGLAALIAALRRAGVDSILVFTGHTLEELEAANASLEGIDVLVAGRYDPTLALESVPLLSSENQRLHLLTSRHGKADIDLRGGNLEITITGSGDVRVTGFPPPSMRRAFRNLGDGE